jgi:N-acetylglucosamine kinase-like BadF-type ATPase
MSGRLVLAVDGGNSKTDLALLREDGAVLALVRGGNSSPHHLGLDGTIALLEQLHAAARARARLDGDARAAVGHLLLAGLDLPVEEERLHAAVDGRWADRLSVGNDTFAVLRAGTERGWGVAVVCGAGINCVGVGPDGRHVRFPALGAISGDWGGGYDVGLAALSAAVRSEDGRGPRTALERAVPEHFGLGTPGELVEAIHLGRVAQRRIVELPPLVFDAAAADPVAAAILDRLAAEVLALVHASIERLELGGAAIEVLLGGGMFRTGDGRLLGAIEAGLGPEVELRVAASEPIVGAALLGLDELGAGPEALARARSELGEVAVHG